MNSWGKVMKVLVMGHSAGQIGGVSNFLRMMQEKAGARHQIDLFTVGPRDTESGALARSLRLLSDYFAFIGFAKKDYDLIHVNPSLDKRSFVRTLVFLLICIMFRKKTVVFFRGWDWDAFRFFFVKSNPVGNIARWILSNSAGFIVLAPAFKAELSRFFPKHRIDVLTTMFDGKYMPVSNFKFYDSPRMLFMSRFIDSKGGIAAIDAYVEVAKVYPDATLVMAGDGPKRVDWENYAVSLGQAAHGVNFVGYVKAETKLAALSDANIFLMPTSHPEGMPNALMEAMGAGLIPVVTEAGGTFDAIKHGELGYMLSEPSAKEMLHAVTSIMSNPTGSTEMSKALRLHAWENFESNAVTSRVINIYEEIVFAS